MGKDANLPTPHELLRDNGKKFESLLLDQAKAGDAKRDGLKVIGKGDGAEKIVNMVIKQDGKIEPASELKTKPPLYEDKQNKASPSLSSETKQAKKEEELPPNFLASAPLLARPRGFMGRFKPQLHRSLLENFGFECVMHYNE